MACPAGGKAKEWRRQLKTCERIASQIVYRGGPNKEARLQTRRLRLSGGGAHAFGQGAGQPAGPV